MTGHLTHVRLLVNDFEACYRFYRDVLGLAPTFGTEGDGYADFDAGPGATLALFDAGEMASALGTSSLGPGRGDGFCLVLRVASVDVAAADLAARGATFVAPPTDRPEWGLRTLHLRDPDGTLVELYEELRTG